MNLFILLFDKKFKTRQLRHQICNKVFVKETLTHEEKNVGFFTYLHSFLIFLYHFNFCCVAHRISLRAEVDLRGLKCSSGTPSDLFRGLLEPLSFKVIVTVKSSGGCLQIGFGHLIIDYIFSFIFDPLNSSYLNLKVSNRSHVCSKEGKYIKIKGHYCERNRQTCERNRHRCE